MGQLSSDSNSRRTGAHSAVGTYRLGTYYVLSLGEIQGTMYSLYKPADPKFRLPVHWQLRKREAHSGGVVRFLRGRLPPEIRRGAPLKFQVQARVWHGPVSYLPDSGRSRGSLVSWHSGPL